MLSNQFVSCCLCGKACAFKSSKKQICTSGLFVGNAAIVLRSRLKVRVLKENWEKKARVDEKGVILTNGELESSRKAVQYQVPAASVGVRR